MDPHADHFAGARKMVQGTGAKHDEGKPRVGLMVTDFPLALQAVAQVSTFGAGKYSPRSWRGVPDARERYTDAEYRHLLAHAAGLATDPESGLSHLAHAAWNALALLELELAQAGPDSAIRTPHSAV